MARIGNDEVSVILDQVYQVWSPLRPKLQPKWVNWWWITKVMRNAFLSLLPSPGVCIGPTGWLLQFYLVEDKGWGLPILCCFSFPNP